MKYINTRYSIFDSSNFQNYFTDSNNGGGFTHGEGKITLPAETTKLYVSMELWSNQNGSNNDPSCWPIQIYFSDGTYNTVKESTVQLHVLPYNGKIYLKTNNAERLQTPWTNQQWHKVYLAIDSVAGTVDFYIDGDKVGTYTDYVKTGVKAINCKIKLSYISSTIYTKARNIIISDQYFPRNEEIILVPATVTADGFSYDSNTNEYSTETENSTLQVKPDLSVLNGYKVTGCNVGMGTTKLGDTIKNIKCDMGTYSNTREIPATGQGMYFDELPTSITNITMTAKK